MKELCMKSPNLALLTGVLTVILLMSAPNPSNGQSVAELNFNISSELDSGLHSPDVQSELELAYKNRFYHVKNDLYLFGRIGGFYQVNPLSGSRSHAEDATQYDYQRFGGSAATGFFLDRSAVGAELGFGLSAHRVILNRTRIGMLPPGTTTTSPERITEWFNTFDTQFALVFNLLDPVEARLSLRIQAPLDDNEYNNARVSPSFGLQYGF